MPPDEIQEKSEPYQADAPTAVQPPTPSEWNPQPSDSTGQVENLSPATFKALEERYSGKLDQHGEQIKMHGNLIIGGFLVAVLGFITLFVTVGAMLQDYIANKTMASRELTNEILDRNAKIDLLYQLEMEQRIYGQCITK